jgi:uncharacterized membrane protein YphA (DoxX/SURF4 family)
MNKITIASWLLRLIAAVIMLQTLFFKFTGAEESVYIFSKLGIEPYGRLGTGFLELLASLLIIYPKTTGIGSVLGVGLMSGAIMAHFTTLGIVVKADGGQLFIYAVLVWVSCVILLVMNRSQVYNLVKLNPKYRL